MNIEPAVLKHAVYVYDALAQEAEPNPELAPADIPVYVGHWTTVMFKLEEQGKTNRQAAYKAMKFLVDAGCVERLQKGTKENPSIIVLNYPPTMEIYKGQQSPTMTSRKSSLAVLKQQVSDITTRMNDLGEAHDMDTRSLAASLDMIAKRLSMLENDMRLMEKGIKVPATPSLPDVNWRDM